MNLAFATILIFIILAPGYVLRKSYNSSKLSVKKDLSTLYLVIPTNDILNINFRYFSIENITDQEYISKNQKYIISI